MYALKHTRTHTYSNKTFTKFKDFFTQELTQTN